MQVVEKNVRKKSLNTWYEAQLLNDNGKSKKVYCYISPRVSDSVWVPVHVAVQMTLVCIMHLMYMYIFYPHSNFKFVSTL